MPNFSTGSAAQSRHLTAESSAPRYSANSSPSSIRARDYLELPNSVKNVLKRQIAAAVEDVLDSMMREGTADNYWRAKMCKDGITYYEDRESVTKKQSRFCCVDSTEASVEKVINLFVVSDTDMMLQRCRFMYDNLLDARLLNVLEYATEEHPLRSTYIRYTAFKARTLQRHHRDMCVVVSTDVIKYPDGSTIGYCVWDSLNLTDISQLDVPKGFVRTRMFRSGYFVQNTGQPGALSKIAYIIGIETGGLAPRLTTRYYMPRFADVLSRVIALLHRQQLDPSTFVHQSLWTNKYQVDFCQCCSKHFGAVKLLGLRRYNCMSCGDAICHACHHIEELRIAGARNMTVGVCVGCITATTRKGTARLSRLSSWRTSSISSSFVSSTKSSPM